MYSNVAIYVYNFYSHQWFFVMHYRLLAVTMYWSQEWKLMPVVFVMEITALQHLYLIHHLKSLTLVHYRILYETAMCVTGRFLCNMDQGVTLHPRLVLLQWCNIYSKISLKAYSNTDNFILT